MRKVSLTDFVDVVSKSGTPKANHVSRVINRPKYSPASDFYKPLRDCIVDTHKNNLPPQIVYELLAHLKDEKKVSNYPEAVNGYCSWWGNKKVQWFEPPAGEFARHGVSVNVNPELGLFMNETPYIIKLYFKGEKLAKSRIDIVTYLMETCLRCQCGSEALMGLLDVRNAKLFCYKASNQNLTAMLGAELAYVAALWER